jgi:hypothetical protein
MGLLVWETGEKATVESFVPGRACDIQRESLDLELRVISAVYGCQEIYLQLLITVLSICPLNCGDL